MAEPRAVSAERTAHGEPGDGEDAEQEEGDPAREAIEPRLFREEDIAEQTERAPRQPKREPGYPEAGSSWHGGVETHGGSPEIRGGPTRGSAIHVRVAETGPSQAAIRTGIGVEARAGAWLRHHAAIRRPEGLAHVQQAARRRQDRHRDQNPEVNDPIERHTDL